MGSGEPACTAALVSATTARDDSEPLDDGDMWREMSLGNEIADDFDGPIDRVIAGLLRMESFPRRIRPSTRRAGVAVAMALPVLGSLLWLTLGKRSTSRRRPAR
jgi:hypothetical protein